MSAAVLQSCRQEFDFARTRLDQTLLATTVALLSLGLIMVSSASIEIGVDQYGDAFYFVRRQALFLCFGLVAGLLILLVPMTFWKEHGGLLLLAAFGLLLIVLVPGVGREVNGSMRWIRLGPFSLQPSEFARLGVILYMAGYLVRQQADVRSNVWGLMKPMGVVSLLIVLLLMEPDFGSSVVLMAAIMGMIFLSGVRLMPFAALILVALTSAALMAVSQEYRMQRLTAFTNPWADAYDTGYQLTQALIAFGRGEWFGVGLGNSVQKLFYLPEAHTDFVYSILAEETGVIGALAMVALFSLLIGRMLQIGWRCVSSKQPFQAYVVWGIAIMMGAQAFVNMGVNMGVLPTKGITLPLVSYGGSSLLVSCIAIALVMRADMECEHSGGKS